MSELSFIIFCNNDATQIDKCVSSVFEALKNDVDYEIIVVNCAENKRIVGLLNALEKEYSDKLTLVNCEETVTEEDSFNIGLEYASGVCFLQIRQDEVLNSDVMSRVVYDGSSIDEKVFKYLHNKYLYIVQSSGYESFRYDDKDKLPCLTDYMEGAGSIDSHYLYQDIYVAGKVHKSGVEHIYDIGSRIDGYISHLLSMGIKVTMIDIRPLPNKIENLDFVQGNATDLSGIEDESIHNLSCLHALEHFGLGRYGDPIDYKGWEKGLDSMIRVLKKGGYFYLSVPVGRREYVMFNAHRIFSPKTIVDRANGIELQEFTFFHDGERTTFDFSRESDKGKITESLNYAQNVLMGDYDCGIFIFRKV